MKIFILVASSFVIPWIIGILIYLRDHKTILTIAPFSSMLSFILNIPGVDYGLFYPAQILNIKPQTLSILANFGSLCILPCMFIYSVRHLRIKPVYLVVIYSAIGTVFDLLLIALRILIYDNGWNIFFSFITFLISLYIVYLYYLWLKKLNMI